MTAPGYLLIFFVISLAVAVASLIVLLLISLLRRWYKWSKRKKVEEESPQLSTITCTECGKENSAGMESNVHGQICCHCSRQPVVLTVAAAQYR